MMYSSTNDCTDAADEDAVLNGENNDDERMDMSIASSRFCTASEHRAVIADHLVLAARAKEIALARKRIKKGKGNHNTNPTWPSRIS